MSHDPANEFLVSEISFHMRRLIIPFSLFIGQVDATIRESADQVALFDLRVSSCPIFASERHDDILALLALRVFSSPQQYDLVTFA